MIEKKPVNPWTWPDAFGYTQAVEVTGGSRTLYLAGQVALAMDNLETTLRAVGYDLGDAVR